VHAVGVDLELVENIGPVIAQPVRTMADLDQLRPLDPDQDVAHVTETIGLVRSELAGSGVALIGFAGAPLRWLAI